MLRPEEHVPMASSTRTIVQAFDGAAIQDLELHDGPAVDTMLESSWRLHRNHPHGLPAHERRAILKRLAALMAPEAEAFALLIAREGGKPLKDARVEVARAINGVDLAAEEMGRLGGHQIPMDLTAAGAGRTAFTIREPIGVVVAISAFNHPLNLIVHQVAPAVAVGCPVIVKPAGTTPLSCLKFLGLLYEAGLPEDWCRFCYCAPEVAGQLAADPRVAFVSFIGSGEVGWRLRSRLAPGARCSLEHGGVAPVIVAADADLERMVPLLVKGGYYHAGQVCVSVQRVFADAKIKAKLVDALVDHVENLVTGDPVDAATDVGPLIQTGEVDRVETWVVEAVESGAGCPIGGHRLSDRVYAPTLLVDPPAGCRASAEEIFGPVLNVYGYDDEDDAVARANALSASFQAAVFTRDVERAMRLSRRLDAAAVMVNDHTAFRVDWMPFGGRRTSGLGVGGMLYAMEDMAPEKLVVIKG